MPAKFLINPQSATRGGPRLWEALRTTCAQLGYVEGSDYGLEWTRPAAATDQARRAAMVCDRLVAVGGDGTVRAVVQGIVQAGTGTALGVIPQGTGNDFSRSVGLYQLWQQRQSIGVAGVVEWLLTAPTASVDVLTANDQCCFVSYAGVGFDAQISRTYDRIRRHPELQWVLRGRAINELTYALLVLRHWRTRVPDLCMGVKAGDAGWLDRRMPRGTCALILSNVSSYAGGAPLVEGTAYDDGQFELTAVPHPWLFIPLIAARAWPRLRRLYQIQSQLVRGVRFHLPFGCAIQLDGEDYTERLATSPEVHIRVATQIRVVTGPHL